MKGRRVIGETKEASALREYNDVKSFKKPERHKNNIKWHFTQMELIILHF